MFFNIKDYVMKRLFLFLILISFSFVYSYSQSEIMLKPINESDFTGYTFSFTNNEQTAVKSLGMQIKTPSIEFNSVSVSGEASLRGWNGIVDPENSQNALFLGDDVFDEGETGGDFNIQFTGNNGTVEIEFSLIGSNGNTLSTISRKMIYSTTDTCVSLDFDNTELVWVDLPASDQYLNPSGFTWECWFRLNDDITNPNSLVWGQQLICIDQPFDWFLGFGRNPNIGRGSLTFGLQPTYVSLPVNLIEGNKWYFAAAVFDGSTSTMSLYVYDSYGNIISGAPTMNVPINPGTISNFPSSDVIPALGRQPNSLLDDNPVNFLDGQMDEIRFWDYARTQAQIETEMMQSPPSSSAGLVAYYPVLASELLWQPTGNPTLFDISGNSNDGSLTGNNTTNSVPAWIGLNAPLYACPGCPCDSILVTTDVTSQEANECCHTVTFDVKCDLPPVGDINYVTLQEVDGLPFTVTSYPSAWTQETQTTYQVPGGLSIDMYEFEFCFDPTDQKNCRQISVELINRTNPNSSFVACKKTVDICCPPCPEINNINIECDTITNGNYRYTMCFDINYTGPSEDFYVTTNFPGGIHTTSTTITGSGSYCVDFNSPYYLTPGSWVSIHTYFLDGNNPYCNYNERIQIPDCCPKVDSASVECLDLDQNGNQTYTVDFGAFNNWGAPVMLNFDVDCGTIDPMFVILDPMVHTPISLTYTNDAGCTNFCLTTNIMVNNDTICFDEKCYMLPPCQGCCQDIDFDFWNDNFLTNTYPCSYLVYAYHHPYAYDHSLPGPMAITRLGATLVRSTLVYECESGYIFERPLHGIMHSVQTGNSYNPTTTWYDWRHCNNYLNVPADFGGFAPAVPHIPGPYGAFNDCSAQEIYWGGYNKLPYIESMWDCVHYRFSFTKMCVPDGLAQLTPNCNIVETRIEYQMRYFFTDTTCCTCDTIITESIVVPNDIQNPATLVANDLTSAKLYLNNNLDKNLNEMRLLADQNNIMISKVINTQTSDEFTPNQDGIITVELNEFAPDKTMEFDLVLSNPDQMYRFDFDVQILAPIEPPAGHGEDHGKSFISLPVTALVPSDGDKDKLEESTIPVGIEMRTLALHLTNMNIYEESIAYLVIKSNTEECKIEAIGRPAELSDGKIVIGFGGNENDANSYNLARPIYLDSLYVPDTPSPSDKWKITPGGSLAPIYLTVSTPIGFEMPMTMEYETFNSEGMKISSGQLTTSISGIIGRVDSPSGFDISCYPNPAASSVTFSVNAEKTVSNASIVITDELGNEIGKVGNNITITEGMNLIPFDLSGLPSGAYFYTFNAGDYSVTKLLNIVK